MSFFGSLCLLVCNRDLRIYSNFEAHELSYEQWKSVLHLSTRWGFASLRKLALKSIRPPTSYDQLVLARTYSVEQWVLPALTALCSRALPLSLDEARQMDIDDVILVASVREEIRGGALQVDAADIPRHVEMAQANRLVSKVYLGKLKSESTGQESGSTMDPVSKSVNASTTDFFGDSLNADGHAPAERGKSQVPPMGDALQAEKLGDPAEDTHTREPLTVTTEVPVAVHMATAGPITPGPTTPRLTTPRPTTPGPTTPGNSRDGGGRNEGEGREDGEKVLEDDRIVPTIVTKDSMNLGAPDAPVPEDEWGIPLKTKKKKGCAECAKRKKKGKEVAISGTPVVPSTGGGVVDGA